ncbi:hypothetical protein NEOLI_005084 [Neolecta irregularis DAH-3]|uniref:Uncharacterized protein n=1 Tax=Neolecta irregularis (strain DAH-3) TaxID=1198029 RepID=A0A1U7LLT6_NEOID|nr:hypothetical protein NEOLI_005084 [Neolecta irregularis DAH-3]|eukprot:OLL23624.1 hypothetical protein NEOLI_005084 [Neolecta irregularis DAH-3]
MNLIVPLLLASNYELVNREEKEWSIGPVSFFKPNPQSLFWTAYGVYDRGNLEETVQYCSKACNNAVFHCASFAVAKVSRENVCALFPRMPTPIDPSRLVFQGGMPANVKTIIYRPVPPRKGPPAILRTIWEYATYQDWKARVVEKYDLGPEHILPLRFFYALLFEYPFPPSSDAIQSDKKAFEMILQNPFSYSTSFSPIEHITKLRNEFTKGFNVLDLDNHSELINAILATFRAGKERAQLDACVDNDKNINPNVWDVQYNQYEPLKKPFIVLEHFIDKIHVVVFSIGFEFSSEEKSRLFLKPVEFQFLYPEEHGFEKKTAEFVIQVYINALLYGNHPNNWKFSQNSFFKDAYLAMIWTAIGGNESKVPWISQTRTRHADASFIFTEE